MYKQLPINLSEEEVDMLDRIKAHMREKTYKKSIVRMVEDYIRINNL